MIYYNVQLNFFSHQATCCHDEFKLTRNQVELRIKKMTQMRTLFMLGNALTDVNVYSE